MTSRLPRPQRWRLVYACLKACVAIFLIAFPSIVHSQITGASVTPASLIAGATGNVDIAFTTTLTIPVGGSILVIFPPAAYIESSVMSNIVGFDTSSTIAVDGNNYQVSITIATTSVTPGSISFTLSQLTNPGDGTTSKYTIKTFDASSNLLEVASNIAGSVLVKTSFSAVALTINPPNAGALALFTVSLTTDVILRAGSRLELEFPIVTPSKFVFAAATINNLVNVDTASVIVTVSSTFVQLTFAGAAISAGTAISVTFGNIYNPAAQAIGTFNVRTRHSNGNILQETLGVTGPTIVSTVLSTTATVTPTSYFGGIVTSFIITFPNVGYMPAGSKITVTFPARFSIGGATLASTTNLPATNTVLSLPTANSLLLTLGSGPLLPGTGRGFTIANIVNPGSSCNQYILPYCTTTWEVFSISLTDGANNMYEQTSSIPGVPIVKKPITFARVRPILRLPLTSTSVTVIFDTQATLPIGGAIQVVFPTGYVIGGSSAASGHVGIPPASTVLTISGSTLTLTIAGANIAPTTKLSVTFSAITTPDWDATGMYIFRTLDTQGNIMEESESINGEGCLYLNSCNGHGTCTLFTSTCMCDTGWGATTDVAAYKAPDCSMRVCPSGSSWTSLPVDTTTAHSLIEECSGMGICDRGTGRCNCVAGFTGSACQRMLCPNNCSKRGRCMSMRDMASAKNGLPLSAPTTYTGAKATTTWDEERVFGCVCDSGWAVGAGSGEIQATEYFGGDCSRRHCPTGNDPLTSIDETDCTGLATPNGGYLTGVNGNKCFIECSNRGICNYKTGICRCFPGFTGYACQINDVFTS